MALEANEEGGPRTFLRITPPFSGRMRARIHVDTAGPAGQRSDPGDRTPDAADRESGVADRDPAHRESDLAERPGDPAAVQVPPERLVADPPAFPSADDTEDELRADPDAEYTPERHRERHVAAVERWRDRVRGSIVDAVDLRLPDGDHRIEVRTLG